jgi:uncharacterized protein
MSSKTTDTPNKLVNEKSPYLLQHAYNPVDWYPWSEEAFKKAKDEDKPIFLSIGYSTCYWCHVMEREVFENKHIAEEMNKMFVNIKVDREERPDVDRVYMSALQAMTGSGGWPMSMFLTNELKPFYGATYVPPMSKYGMPGFEELIRGISDAWKTKRDEVTASGEKIIEHIKDVSRSIKSDNELNEEMLLKGAQQYKNGFDEEYGGFGGAPKFPRPVGFNFLLRAYKRYEDNESLKMVVRTLMQMARGGVYDHLGGGFHRYSVDRYWRVPHFEKMLYDQAQLAVTYTEAYQITGDKNFGDTAKDILAYVSRELTSPEGGFFSAEDAESALSADDPNEKEEGAFYVWEKKEIDELLGEDAEIFSYYYGADAYGNAPQGSDPHSVFVEKNILYVAHSISETSNKFEKSTNEISEILDEGKKILFKVREKRPKSHLDDKVLTSWNGLMISAFAKAYQVFGYAAYLEKAVSAAEFIITNLYDKKTNLLLHRYRDGEARISGTLEDYAFFTQGLLDLYESSFDEKYLEIAAALTKRANEDFYDNESGAYYDTSGKDESILVRTKEDYDSAEPTGNSIAILNLARLSYLIGDTGLYDKAYNSVLAFSDKLEKMPYAMPQMLVALEYILFKPKQIIIAGKENDEMTYRMLQEVYRKFMPGKVLIQIDPANAGSTKTFARDIIAKSDKTTAYICENFACNLPVTELDEFIKLAE